MTNTIIKASAGSGKTFQLSNEFIGILLRADAKKTSDKINAILASTFTRKAAGEILDRILTRLAEAALNEDKQNDLAKHIPLPGKNVAERTKLLQQVVAQLARNLYRLRICTLDSFFNKIATSFSLELSLPLGWSMLEEAEYSRCILDAVQEVFDESYKNEARKLLNLLHKGEQKQTVTQELFGLATKLLPLVQATNAECWDHSAHHKLGHLTLGKMPDTALASFDIAFTEDKETFYQLLPKTKQGLPDGNCRKGLDKFIENTLLHDWEGLLTGAIGQNFLAGNYVIHAKPIEPELRDMLLPIVQHARAIWAETIVHQTIATRTLLDLVLEKLNTILRQKRGFRFEDITFCLSDLFANRPNVISQKQISHRMDASTEHLLLDEFQDTSSSQWSILKPFVQTVRRGADSSFFCVGDLKQAIYGWRGGTAEIFESVSELLDSEGSTASGQTEMNETRRNSQAVIDAVNRVFLNIGTNESVLEKSPVAAAKWQDWFGNEKHQTLSPDKEYGHCLLESVPLESALLESAPLENVQEEDNGVLDTEAPFWKYVLDRVKQLHEDHPTRSIGILFRRREDIPTVLQGLNTRHVEASDESGVPLTDSAAVQHVLSLMTLIDHPGDTVVRYHLAHGPLAELLELPDYADDVQAETVARLWRQKLLTLGYGKTVNELKSALTPCGQKEQQRLEKLLELAYQFDAQAVGTRTRLFIETVKTTRMQAPGANLVSVMTIHKSKGLEFDIVVLPDLAGRLIGQTPQVIASNSSPTEPVNLVLRWVKDKLRSVLPENYQQAFSQWQDNQVKESLAVLYVAMTRARHKLVMLIPEKSGKGTYASVLRAGLADHGEGNILYQVGRPNWDEAAKNVPPSPNNTLSNNTLSAMAWNSLSSKKVRRNLPRSKPSGMISHAPRQQPQPASGNRESGGVAGQTLPAALRGTAIHACFANVRWLDDEDVDRMLLQKTVEQTILYKRNDLDAMEIVQDFLAMSKQSEVQKVLLRSSYPGDEHIDIEHERRFAVRWQDKLLHGSIDRFVIRRRKDKITALEIIDFKTDRPLENESVSQFTEKRIRQYSPQLDAYRQAVRTMYHQVQVQDIDAKIVFTAINKVITIK